MRIILGLLLSERSFKIELERPRFSKRLAEAKDFSLGCSKGFDRERRLLPRFGGGDSLDSFWRWRARVSGETWLDFRWVKVLGFGIGGLTWRGGVLSTGGSWVGSG